MSDGKIRVVPEKEGAAKVVLEPASWMAQIDFIKHLILENNVLISLLGEQGSGKTTFANLLQMDLSPEIKPCLIAASPLFDPAGFLQQLSAALDIGGEPSISNFIVQSNDQKAYTLLIIDDAHYLPAAFIESILKELQQQSSGRYFHVCLVSDFSLVPTLNTLAQNEYTDMVHSIELGFLSENETKTYVVQNVVPHPGTEKIISDERVKQFYQLTEGHIVKINRQMVDFFSYRQTKPLHNNRMFRHVSIAAGVFLAATGSVYLWMSQDYQSPPAQLVSLESPSPSNNSDLQIQPVLSSDIPAYTIAAVRQALLVTSIRRVELSNTDGEEDSADEALPVMDKVVVAPKIVPHQVKENPVTKVALKPMTKPVVIKSVIEQNRYTIQILAGRNAKDLKRFAEVHHINGKAQVRITKNQGTVWYVLTLGEYSERQHAKQAVNQLPKDIVQFKPWVRLIGDLKVAG